MEQLEERKPNVRKEFAKKRRNQIITAVPLIAVMVLMGLADGKEAVLGVPIAVAGPVAIVIILAGLGFSLYNWRCPACNRYLGKALSPQYCSKCGVALS